MRTLFFGFIITGTASSAFAYSEPASVVRDRFACSVEAKGIEGFADIEQEFEWSIERKLLRRDELPREWRLPVDAWVTLGRSQLEFLIPPSAPAPAEEGASVGARAPISVAYEMNYYHAMKGPAANPSDASFRLCLNVRVTDEYGTESLDCVPPSHDPFDLLQGNWTRARLQGGVAAIPDRQIRFQIIPSTGSILLSCSRAP